MDHHHHHHHHHIITKVINNKISASFTTIPELESTLQSRHQIHHGHNKPETQMRFQVFKQSYGEL
jgi:hypothetical protein